MDNSELKELILEMLEDIDIRLALFDAIHDPSKINRIPQKLESGPEGAPAWISSGIGNGEK